MNINDLANTTEDLYIKLLSQRDSSSIQLAESRQIAGTPSAMRHFRGLRGILLSLFSIL
jgi:hypothetical protein